MIQGIHHTCITVSDLERSIEFYRDLLGLELVMTEESERSGDDRSKALGVAKAKVKLAILRAAEAQVELIEYVTARGGPTTVTTTTPAPCTSPSRWRTSTPSTSGCWTMACALLRRPRQSPPGRWRAGGGPTFSTRMVSSPGDNPDVTLTLPCSWEQDWGRVRL